MTDILKATLKPSDQSIATRVGDETVLLNLDNATYFGMDSVGSRIWEMLKEGVPPLAICQQLADEYGTPLNRVEDDTRRFLSDLEEHGIILVE